MNSPARPAPAEPPEKAPAAVPLFGSWRRAYALAIALFTVEIALLYAFTRYFA